MNGDGYDDFMGYITDEGMHAWLGGTNINYAVPDFDMSPPWYGGHFQRSWNMAISITMAMKTR